MSFFVLITDIPASSKMAAMKELRGVGAGLSGMSAAMGVVNGPFPTTITLIPSVVEVGDANAAVDRLAAAGVQCNLLTAEAVQAANDKLFTVTLIGAIDVEQENQKRKRDSEVAGGDGVFTPFNIDRLVLCKHFKNASGCGLSEASNAINGLFLSPPVPAVVSSRLREDEVAGVVTLFKDAGALVVNSRNGAA